MNEWRQPRYILIQHWITFPYNSQDGTFISPELPESASEAKIFVQLPGGSNKTNFTAPFVSDVAPAFVELIIGAADNGNRAPTVVVSASVGVDKLPSK